MATAPPAKRLRTGGHRQRLDQQRAEIAPQEGSELAEYLLRRFAWGELSAQQLQELASLALKDADSQNRDLSKLRQLAAAGTNGQHQHKCYADVMKVAAPDNRLPSAFLQRLPFKAPLQTLLQAFLLPHMLFSAIYHSYPDTWRQCICPDAKRVEEFWRSVEGSPCVVAAIKAKRNFRQRLIPLALHGDGVPVTGLGKGWVQTVTNFSWYSLLTRAASTADSLFFIWAMFDKLQKRARDASGTAHRFFMLLRWSFAALFEGCWPKKDYLGKELLAVAWFVFVRLLDLYIHVFRFRTIYKTGCNE